LTALPELRSKPNGGSVDASSLDAALAARVERECRGQGVPVGLDDAVAIDAILSLLKDWTATDPDPKPRRNRRQKRSQGPARAS
jgi:hypothetical protein